MYVIEDNVPIPVGTCHAKSEVRLTMEALEVGQSFLLPVSSLLDAKSESKLRGRLTTNAANVRKATGKTFVFRRAEGGYRVWRVS